MGMSNYVLVMISHHKLIAGKPVLVKIGGEYKCTDTYKTQAFKIACLNLGFDPSDCELLDWKFLGNDLTLVL